MCTEKRAYSHIILFANFLEAWSLKADILYFPPYTHMHT